MSFKHTLTLALAGTYFKSRRRISALARKSPGALAVPYTSPSFTTWKISSVTTINRKRRRISSLQSSNLSPWLKAETQAFRFLNLKFWSPEVNFLEIFISFPDIFGLGFDRSDIIAYRVIILLRVVTIYN